MKIDNDAMRKAILEEKSNKEQKKKKEKDVRFYNSFIDLKKTNEFKSIIRILPPSETYHNFYVKGAKHSVSLSRTNWLEEQCPEFYNKEHKCPVCAYLRSKWPEFSQEERNKFKRKIYFIANILVIKDPQNTELEGKVMLWKYPQKIQDKIMSVFAPTDDMSEPINVFNYDNQGMNFKLEITKNGEFYNYDKSNFMTQSALYGGDEEKIIKVHKNLYDLGAVMKEIVGEYNPEDLRSKLDRIINPPMLNEVADDSSENVDVTPVQTAAPKKADLDDLDF